MPACNVPLFYDGSSFSSIPVNLQKVNDDGMLVPPPGFSFVTMGVPSTSVEHSVSAEPVGEGELLSVPSATETVRSRSSSVVSDVEAEISDSVAAKPQNKKYRHRSKQTRILEVHQKLKEEYTAKGLYANDDEVLRGFDTVRIHVKTYKALNRVELPLNEVENHPEVKVLKIATPFSMKNRFQKKGFIVYLKLASADMVPTVQSIFANYKEDFAKCDVALKKEDKLALEKAKNVASEGSFTFNPQPSPDFLSTRAFSREGLEFSDWANMAA